MRIHNAAAIISGAFVPAIGLVAVTDDGTVYSTGDGREWQKSIPRLPLDGGVKLMLLCFSQQSGLWALLDDGSSYQINPGAAEWAQMEGPAPRVAALAPAAPAAPVKGAVA